MSLFIHRERLPRLMKRCPVSTVLIIFITLSYLFDLITYAFIGRKIIFEYGALVPVFIKLFKDYHRLILPIFIHASPLHFLFNTFFGIAVLGMGLEKLIGSWKYAIVFFVSALGASLLIYFVNINRDPSSVTVGASGAIFGVLGVFLYIIIFRRDVIFESDRKYLSGLILMNVIFTFAVPGISILGHLGGLITGFILGFFIFLPGISDRMHHRKLRREWKKLRKSNW